MGLVPVVLVDGRYFVIGGWQTRQLRCARPDIAVPLRSCPCVLKCTTWLMALRNLRLLLDVSRRHSDQVLPQQIYTERQKADILHKESDHVSHCGKSAGRFRPGVWQKRDDRDGRDERKTSPDGSEDTQLFIPKPRNQEHPKHPFRSSHNPPAA